jgi:hypothetical protein
MDLPAEEAWRAGQERDGAEQRGFWAGWIPAERRHFARDPSRPFADWLVRRTGDGTSAVRGEEYLVLPGPVGTT